MGGCGCSGNQKASMIFKDCGCGCKGKKQEHKFIISIMSAMIFFVVANPETFRAMRGIVGGWVSSPTGCPTIKGLALHTVVFMLVVWGLMNIRKEGQENPPPEEQMGAEMPPPPPAAGDAMPPPRADAAGGDMPPTAQPPAVDSAEDMNALLAEINNGTPPPAGDTTEININAQTDMMVQAPPAQGMNNTADLGTDEDYEENTLAPYSPLENGDPSMGEMASTATSGMSQKLGGPVATTQPQDTLRMGNYMQCKCGDGSHVMLMK